MLQNAATARVPAITENFQPWRAGATCRGLDAYLLDVGHRSVDEEIAVLREGVLVVGLRELRGVHKMRVFACCGALGRPTKVETPRIQHAQSMAVDGALRCQPVNAWPCKTKPCIESEALVSIRISQVMLALQAHQSW